MNLLALFLFLSTTIRQKINSAKNIIHFIYFMLLYIGNHEMLLNLVCESDVGLVLLVLDFLLLWFLNQVMLSFHDRM